LTLDVAPGERIVVHGPNGSGKTTLLRVLTGERAPSAGTVTVCGVDLVGAGERDRVLLRSRRLGLVDQHHARMLRPELSIVDNVALQLRLTGVGRARAVASARRLLDRLGLGHLAGRRPVSLSGGEAQQAAVCAAVAHEPALILADEPTGELDRASADAVYDLLAAVASASGAALVLVSHDVRATRIAERVVRIRDGRLSEEWSPDGADRETLVVDDRGWVRLPEPLRRRTGANSRVRAEVSDGAIVLAGLGEPLDAPTVPANAEPAPDPAPAPGEEVVELSGVTVDRDGRRVLSGQDLRLRRGTLTVIQGRSGSGKTTLLRVLTGLERPDTGVVRVLGTDLGGLDRTALADLRRRYVSLAGQGNALIETLDVIGNLELVRQARGLEPTDALDGWLIEIGLEPLRHRPVRVLSGGERQRVSLARVLAVEPVIAVLDEPTSQQDEANAERIVGVLLAAARRGAAVVAATHDPVLVRAADEVVRLA
jgi:ABC-type lipoprotein export system ATPase subunit